MAANEFTGEPPKGKDILPTVEGRDYVLENGLFTLSRDFLSRRGVCCDSGCRRCPYKQTASTPDLLLKASAQKPEKPSCG